MKEIMQKSTNIFNRNKNIIEMPYYVKFNSRIPANFYNHHGRSFTRNYQRNFDDIPQKHLERITFHNTKDILRIKSSKERILVSINKIKQ